MVKKITKKFLTTIQKSGRVESEEVNTLEWVKA